MVDPRKELYTLGFGTTESIIKPRLIMSVEGHEKRGKTHFACTAPGPTAYFNLDVGSEGVIEKFGDKIIPYPMYLPISADTTEDLKKEAREIWDNFTKAYNRVQQMKYIRTVIVDTASELWELVRIAWYGKTTQVMPYQYTPLNAEFKKLVNSALTGDKNVIFLHRLKPVYINDKRTKEYERAGWGEMGYKVQVSCKVGRTDAYEDDDGKEVPVSFHANVRECRQKPEMNGQWFEGDMCNFPMVAAMIMPDIDPEYWGL